MRHLTQGVGAHLGAGCAGAEFHDNDTPIEPVAVGKLGPGIGSSTLPLTKLTVSGPTESEGREGSSTRDR